MDWTRADIISALALLVSSLSGWVSWKAYQRTAAAQHPHFSYELEPFDEAEWWHLECVVDNRSLVGLEPIEVRTSKFGDPSLSTYKGAMIGSGGFWQLSEDITRAPLSRTLELRERAYPIDSQTRGEFTVILKARPGKRRLVVRCRTIEARPRRKRFVVHLTIPESPALQWIKSPRV